MISLEELKGLVSYDPDSGLFSRLTNCRVGVNGLAGTVNLKKYKNNTTSVTGVYWYSRRSRWHATIDCRGKREELGYFISKEDAIVARHAAEARLFGEYRRAL